jgi:hypothetical protein
VPAVARVAETPVAQPQALPRLEERTAPEQKVQVQAQAQAEPEGPPRR